MKIMVDGFNLALEKGTGVATYARNLSYNIHALGYDVSILYGAHPPYAPTDLMREIAFFDEQPEQRRKWVYGLQLLAGMIRNVSSFSSYRIPDQGTVIKRQFASRLPYYDSIYNSANLFRLADVYFSLFGRMSNVAINLQPDVAHWTYPLPVCVPGAVNIYTIHDLVPLRLPYTTLDNKNRYYQLVKKIADTADHIVTVSENSRKDIIDILGVPEDKVTNTYQSVEIPEKYLAVDEGTLRNELMGAFRLEHKQYLLYFGAIEPKKNIGRMIEAYLAANIDMPLVIVGAEAWKSEQELKLLIDDNMRILVKIGDETVVRRKIVRLDYVTFSQLVNLIRGARCTMFASLYEGFGLPILESMLCGTPVITSDFGATKEIAGDSAILVDPYDTRAIRDAIVEVASNDGLLAKKAKAGIKTANNFSAEKYQERLGELYKEIGK